MMNSADLIRYSQSYYPSCGICLEEFHSESTQPKLLRCGHNYCQQCICAFINNSTTSTDCKCPACRQPFDPNDQFPTNYAMIDFLKFIESTKLIKETRQQSYRNCSECDASISREKMRCCDNCLIILCSDCCIDNHAGHTINSFNQIKQQCYRTKRLFEKHSYQLQKTYRNVFRKLRTMQDLLKKIEKSLKISYKIYASSMCNIIATIADFDRFIPPISILTTFTERKEANTEKLHNSYVIIEEMLNKQANEVEQLLINDNLSFDGSSGGVDSELEQFYIFDEPANVGIFDEKNMNSSTNSLVIDSSQSIRKDITNSSSSSSSSNAEMLALNKLVTLSSSDDNHKSMVILTSVEIEHIRYAYCRKIDACKNDVERKSMCLHVLELMSSDRIDIIDDEAWIYQYRLLIEKCYLRLSSITSIAEKRVIWPQLKINYFERLLKTADRLCRNDQTHPCRLEILVDFASMCNQYSTVVEAECIERVRWLTKIAKDKNVERAGPNTDWEYRKSIDMINWIAFYLMHCESKRKLL